MKNPFENFKTLFNLAILRSGPETDKLGYFNEAEIYKQFRIVFPRGRCEPIVNKNSKYPHVFCRSNVMLHQIINSIDYINDVCGKNKNIIFGASDKGNARNLRRRKSELTKHFNHIFLEALTYRAPSYVKTFPMGFTWDYLKNANEEIFGGFVNSTIKIQKDKIIGTAFGKWWPELSNPNSTYAVGDRIQLGEFVENSKIIEDFYCESGEYHWKKSKYLYFANPRGQGVQSPKIYESFMCETVPVVTNATYAQQLKYDYNLPIHIIDKWENLSESNLLETYDKEYANYDWKSLKRRFLVDNFIEEFLSGKNYET